MREQDQTGGIIMKPSIKNWIGGKHPLDENLCAVSLILSQHGEHAYILIESLNAENKLETLED